MPVDLERQDFESLAATCSNSIYDLSTCIRRTEKLAAKVDKDPAVNRNSEKLSSEMVAIGSKCTETGAIVEQLTKWPADLLSGSQRSQQQDINSGFDSILKNVHTLQQKAAKAITKVASAAGAASDATGRLQSSQSGSASTASENTPLLQQLVSTDLSLHNNLLEDREQEISEIQRGMMEINSIFRDLGVLVAEQGTNLDTIEENVTDMARQTNDAANQLFKAETYQRSRGKWSCIALLVLLVITILVALSIFA